MRKMKMIVSKKNQPRCLEAFGVFSDYFSLHKSGVHTLKNKQFRKMKMVNKKHRIFRMRDGPPVDTEPPYIGTNQTGPPMQWLVLKQTRARY